MTGPALAITLADDFWAPRRTQLRDQTLPVLLERLADHGVVEAFTRLREPATASPRRGLWFTDSDLYKWMEAAALGDRLDLLEPVADAVLAAQHPDGYLHSFYGLEPFGAAAVAGGEAGRYRDLRSSHEWYCAGHFIEAALAHHRVSGSDALLAAARRLADHLCATFGPGRDERIDDHPEIELALARLAVATGEERYLDVARWTIETLLTRAGHTLDTVDLAGHAVRMLYLASGIAEVALATGEAAWTTCARRLWSTLVNERSYPTGAVGGRWLGEAVGRPFELGDETAYAESCSAVAALQYARRMYTLTGDPACLDHLEVVLYNAVACGVGADGTSWFYSQPQAWHGEAGYVEQNLWAQPLEFQEQMQLRWFPPRRHRWFDVTCCPTNLARMFALVPDEVARLDAGGGLHVDLPVASRIAGGEWEVRVEGAFPAGGPVVITVEAAPPGAAPVRIRVPGRAGTPSRWATVPADAGASLAFDVEASPTWHRCDPRVTTAIGRRYQRRGALVYCLEVPATSGIDLRLPQPAPADRPDWRPYHQWANAGPSRMTVLVTDPAPGDATGTAS